MADEKAENPLKLPKATIVHTSADIGLDTGGSATSNTDLPPGVRTEAKGPRGFLGLGKHKIPKDVDPSKT